MRRRWAFLALLSMLGSALAGGNPGVVVVASPHGPAAALSEADARALFLGRDAAGHRPGAFQVVDYHGAIDLREAFYRRVSGRTAAQMDSFWTQRLLVGAGRAPLRVKDAADLRNVLLQHDNALGFAWEANAPPDLIVVCRIDD